MWIVFALLAVICLVIAVVVSPEDESEKSKEVAVLPPNQTEVMMPADLPALTDWNEVSITRQLQQLRGQKPSLVVHFVDSMKERFIVRQDDRTAQVRLQFLRNQIEQLKLNKDFQQLLDDLELLSLEREKRVKTLELENQELDVKKRSLNQKEKLESLREQRKMELEIAQLEQQIQAVKISQVAEPKLSAEERRDKEKEACEARIQSLKQEKQKALKIEDEAERVQRVNAIDDAIQREMERWAKLL
jgi:hypothetical protein